jgi:hypothetical protein
MAAAILLVSVAVPASATASAGRVVVLPQHGTLLLAGSQVTCGSGTTAGQTFIDCGIIGTKGNPKAGSYVALMTRAGKVTVFGASTNTIVFSRTPAARVRSRPDAAGSIAARAGDRISLPGVPSISCQVSDTGKQTTIICYHVDAKGVVLTGSYSFGMSDVVVTTLGWSKTRKASLLGHWPENG